MSKYESDPFAAPAVIRVYRKRRRSTWSYRVLPTSVPSASEPAYADFFSGGVPEAVPFQRVS